jgi:hypothetical protein
MTQADTVAAIRAAWKAMTGANLIAAEPTLTTNSARSVPPWLWTSPDRESRGTIPISEGVSSELARQGIPTSARRPRGDDTVVFRIAKWTGDGPAELQFVSEWTTVLGSGSRSCRTGGGFVANVRAIRAAGGWTAKLLMPVEVGDDVCVPIPPVNR